jgi:hypothetical protein
VCITAAKKASDSRLCLCSLSVPHILTSLFLCVLLLFFFSKYVHIGVQITFCVFSVNVGFLFLDATRSLFLVSLFVCDWTSLAE